MPGQIVESSFSPRMNEPFAQETADAFGRAQTIAAQLQISQAQNALTQQEINIRQAAQQTQSQQAQVEMAGQQVRTQMLQQFGPQAYADQHETSRMANLMTAQNIKDMGGDPDVNIPAKTMGEALNKAHLQQMQDQHQQLQQATARSKYEMQSQDEQQRQNNANSYAATLLHIGQTTGNVTNQDIARARGAIGKGTVLDLLDEKMTNSSEGIVKGLEARALQSDDPTTRLNTLNFVEKIRAGQAGLVDHNSNAPNPINPKTGQPMFAQQEQPVEKMVSDMTKGLSAMGGSGGKDSGQGVQGEPSSATSSAQTFQMKPTGNDLVDRTIYHAQQSGNLGDVRMGEVGGLLPSKQGRVNAVLSRDPSGAKINGGEIQYDSAFMKNLTNTYGEARTMTGGEGDRVGDPERAIVDQALKVDPQATIQQQMVYNATLKEVLKLDLTNPEKVPVARSLIEKAVSGLTPTQTQQLGMLIKNFK